MSDFNLPHLKQLPVLASVCKFSSHRSKRIGGEGVPLERGRGPGQDQFCVPVQRSSGS